MLRWPRLQPLLRPHRPLRQLRPLPTPTPHTHHTPSIHTTDLLLFSPSSHGQVPACTYEGDNTIMFLQTARELVNIHNVTRGIRHTAHNLETTKKKNVMVENKHPSPAIKSPPHSLERLYGKEATTGTRSPMKSAEDCVNLQMLAVAFHHRARRLVLATCVRLNGQVDAGHSFEVAYEGCKVDLVRCARAHCWMLILNNFIDALKGLRDPSLAPILTSLCRLFALSHIEKEMGDFTEDGYLDAGQAEMVRGEVRRLLAALRVDAVAIVDSFDFSDHYLNSALGKWDGNVYECLYKWARTGNPMNESDIAPGVERILLPLMKNGRKLAEKEQKALKAKL